MVANIGNEWACLGALIKDPTSHKFLSFMQPSFFSCDLTKRIFAIVVENIRNKVSMDAISIAGLYESQYPNDDCKEFVQFVAKLSNWNIASYILVLKDFAVKREAQKGIDEIRVALDKGYSAHDVATLMSRHGSLLNSLLNVAQTNDKRSIMERVSQRLTNDDAGHRYYTGLPSIDAHGGYGRVFSLLTARYGVGKTPFAMRIALTNILKGIPVGFWSGENDDEDIIMGFLSMLSNVSLRRILAGVKELTNEEQDKLADAQEALLNSPLHFLRHGRKNYYQLEAEARKLQEQHGIEIFILDQFSFLEYDHNFKNRNDAYDLLADQLFDLKKSIPAWWILLAQLKTKNVKDLPVLRDLMWATKLEQNSDCGWVVDRPDADPARMEEIEGIRKVERRNIEYAKGMSKEDKEAALYEFDNTPNLNALCTVSQEKGRMGLGTWRVNVYFDEQAQGFYEPELDLI